MVIMLITSMCVTVYARWDVCPMERCGGRLVGDIEGTEYYYIVCTKDRDQRDLVEAQYWKEICNKCGYVEEYTVEIVKCDHVQ